MVGLAERDARVVAAAMIGSLALGDGDDWSDLDFTLGLAEEASVGDVMEDWAQELRDAFEAVPLLDLDTGALTYRVFLLPRWLQLDLSFARGGVVRTGEPFRLLFGPTRTRAVPPESARMLFGWAVLYARHALVELTRERWWHAEFCVSGVRDHALRLACLRRGLPTAYGKGFDRLPVDVLARFEGALVRSLEPAELRRALAVAVAGLLEEAADVGTQEVHAQLRVLTSL